MELLRKFSLSLQNILIESSTNTIDDSAIEQKLLELADEIKSVVNKNNQQSISEKGPILEKQPVLESDPKDYYEEECMEILIMISEKKYLEIRQILMIVKYLNINVPWDIVHKCHKCESREKVIHYAGICFTRFMRRNISDSDDSNSSEEEELEDDQFRDNKGNIWTIYEDGCEGHSREYWDAEIPEFYDEVKSALESIVEYEYSKNYPQCKYIYYKYY
jgi:hypothetical protein